MRRFNSVAAAAAAEIYRKQLLRSAPICDFSHRSLSAAAGIGMRRLNSAALFAAAAAAAAAAAQIYRKKLLRSAPLCDFSHRALSTEAAMDKNYERKRLPAELSALRNVVELTCESAAGVCHVYLIGTWHRTQISCEEVKALIEFVKPEVVFMELCPNRSHFLKREHAQLGGEFRVAYEEAVKHRVRKIILGDRPINVTRARYRIMAHYWERLVYLPKRFRLMAKMVRQLDEDEIKRIFEHKDFNLVCDGIRRILRFKDFNPANEEIQSIYPSRYETMIIERDQYMSATLLEAARQCNSVVAIVGEAHLPGIQKYWKQPVDMKQLLHVPARTRMVTSIRRVLLNHIHNYKWG